MVRTALARLLAMRGDSGNAALVRLPVQCLLGLSLATIGNALHRVTPVHGALDFIGEAVQVLVQAVEDVALVRICGKIADPCGLCGIRSKLLDRCLIILHGTRPLRRIISSTAGRRVETFAHMQGGLGLSQLADHFIAQRAGWKQFGFRAQAPCFPGKSLVKRLSLFESVTLHPRNLVRTCVIVGRAALTVCLRVDTSQILATNR